MWFQPSPSFLIASIQACLSSSSETPSIVKFLFLYWLYAATTLGFSCRQGPHQLAQKSTSKYLPLKLLMLTGLPFMSCMVRLGAGLPTSGYAFGLASAIAVCNLAFSVARPLLCLKRPEASLASLYKSSKDMVCMLAACPSANCINAGLFVSATVR